jgi:hypothetical protein
LSKEETAIQKVISVVDESFDKGTFTRIRVVMLRYLFSIVSIGAFIFAYYWSQVAAQAAVANLLELSIAIDAEATAIAALGLTMFVLVLGRDWADSEKARAERLFFKKLESKADPITLRGLIRMRIALPKGITLEQARSANPGLFTTEEFVRRLLE